MNAAVPALPVFYSFRRCPYAMRARLALLAGGISVELREVVLGDKPQAMLAASPKGTVPVLVNTDGTVIDESLDIMRWALSRQDPEHWLIPASGTPDEMLALISVCDGEFKHHLDRYKYPQRYAVVDASIHRTAGAEFLARLNGRLAAHDHLFGERPALADMAIAPFVRQYAATEAGWFNAQPWPALQGWLARFVASPAFIRIMEKYPKWEPGTSGVPFP